MWPRRLEVVQAVALAEVVVLEAPQAVPLEQQAGPQAARLEQQEVRPDLPLEQPALPQVQQEMLRVMQQAEWVQLQVVWDRLPLGQSVRLAAQRVALSDLSEALPIAP